MMRSEKPGLSETRASIAARTSFGELVQPTARLVGVLLGIIAILILSRIVQYGLTPIRILQLATSLAMILVCLKAGAGLRAGWQTFCIAGFMLLSFTGVVQFGLAAPGIFALVATNVLAAVFLRKPVAQVLLLVQFLFFLLIAAAFRFELAQPRVDLSALNAEPFNWFLLAVSLSILSIFCIHLVERTCLHWQAVNTALAQQKEKLETLVRYAPEGIVVQDMNTGCFTVVNPAAERLLSASAEDLVGRAGLRDFFRESGSGDEMEAYLLTALEGQVPRFEWELRDRKGREFPCEMTLARLPDSERPLVRVSLTDMSDRAEMGRMRILNSALHRNQNELLQQNRKLSRKVEVDQLTGLTNRFGLIRKIDAALQGDDAETVVLVSLDIDQLKKTNDRYGHAIGDLVLQQLSQRLQACLEGSETLSRHSGDEFSVVLEGTDAVERARCLVGSLRSELSRPFEFQGGKMLLSASFAIAFSPDHATDATGLIRAADQALYVAKTSGGNRVVNYTPEIGRCAHDRVRLVDEIEQGLERGDFRLLYQPVVALEDGRIAKVEALVRWQHPELGLLGPDRFIPHAEEAWVIDRIGDWVFHQCVHDLPAMQARFGKGFQASVNVSPLQLASADTSRFEAWEESLKLLGNGNGGGLVFEITESAMLDPNPATLTRLQAFRAAGVQIALDDFGAGHTSLLYYLNHEFDFLKIDREFVRNGPESPRAQALCESLLGFARRLDAVAIAEGVETQQQVDMLREAGCPLGQGYFFSPPLTLEKLLGLPSTLPLG